jgi:hypothetical protein
MEINGKRGYLLTSQQGSSPDNQWKVLVMNRMACDRIPKLTTK